MSKTNNNHTSGGGGFLGCLCRPKHLEDTGVYPPSTYMNGTTSRNMPTSNHGSTNITERPRGSSTTTSSSIQPSTSQQFGSNTDRTNKDYIRQSHIGVMNREIPLIPSPPSDDATPLMSNRKVGGLNHTTTTLPPSLPPPPTSKSKKSTLKITEGTKILLVKTAKPPSTTKLQVPPPPPPPPPPPQVVVDHTTTTEHPEDEMEEYGNHNAVPRKSVSYYPNHVQDNVKVMREYYEQQAFLSNTPSGSRSSYEDMTESTMEDITESSSAMDDLLATTTTNNNPSSLLLRIDCQDDPYESAYAVWYRKGLLKWRPKSVPHSELSSTVSSAFAFPDTTSSFLENNDNSKVKEDTAVSSSSNGIASKNSVDFDVVQASTPPIVPPPKMNTNKTSTTDPNDDVDVDDDMIQTRSLLEKYRSSTSTTKSCPNCQKDLKHTIPIVKCTLCQQELYCSIFCRGNDRYTHSTTCRAQQQPQEPPTVSSSDPTGMTTTSTISTVTTTTPKSSQRRSNSNHNNSPVVILDENSTSRSNSYKKSRQVPMVSLFGHQNSNGNSSSTNNLDTTTTLSARRLTTEFRV